MNNVHSPAPTPEYESFKMARGKYGIWWMYDWKATVALFIIGGSSFAAARSAYDLFDGSFLWATVVGILAGLAAGISYNMLAEREGWQKLHWLDIAFWDLPVGRP